MWQRFTEKARRVVFYSQEEASRRGENFVSTEHLLLGLMHDTDSVAVRVLGRLGIDIAAVKAELERLVTPGEGKLGQEMQLTPRAKRVIDLAYDEARMINNNYIGTEHMLLGLIREAEGLAGRVLISMGVGLEDVRREVRNVSPAQPTGQVAQTLPPREEPDPGSDQRDESTQAVARRPRTRGTPRWNRFTERAQRVVFCAQAEASNLGCNAVSPQHLLFGLVSDDNSVAAQVLNRLGVPLDSLKADLEPQMHRGAGRFTEHLQLTLPAKRVAEFAHEEATLLNNNQVGTQHLLLGILRAGGCLAARILVNRGLSADQIRCELAALQDSEIGLSEEGGDV